MSKTKRLIEQAVLLAINSISEDIRTNDNEELNNISASSILKLAEAYDIVHRGKRGERSC